MNRSNAKNPVTRILAFEAGQVAFAGLMRQAGDSPERLASIEAAEIEFLAKFSADTDPGISEQLISALRQKSGPRVIEILDSLRQQILQAGHADLAFEAAEAIRHVQKSHPAAPR